MDTGSVVKKYFLLCLRQILQVEMGNRCIVVGMMTINRSFSLSISSKNVRIHGKKRRHT